MFLNRRPSADADEERQDPGREHRFVRAVAPTGAIARPGFLPLSTTPSSSLSASPGSSASVSPNSRTNESTRCARSPSQAARDRACLRGAVRPANGPGAKAIVQGPRTTTRPGGRSVAFAPGLTPGSQVVTFLNAPFRSRTIGFPSPVLASAQHATSQGGRSSTAREILRNGISRAAN